MGEKIKNCREDVTHGHLNSECRWDHNKHPGFQISVSSPYISGNLIRMFQTDIQLDLNTFTA